MRGPRRSGPTPADPAGGKGSWRPSLVFLVIALGMLALGSWLLWFPSPPGPVALESPAGSTSHADPVVAVAPQSMAATSSATPIAAPGAVISSAPAPRISRMRDPNGDLTPDISDYVNNGEKPTMAEVIDRLHQAGVQSGLGAFSPPGTRPPLIGLAVPEDFVLPEGYVRHYQATDDGQRIEAILMFSPDHQFYDAAQRPIAIPKDRVVPPELAPPGLPIRRVAIPAPTEPGR